MAHDRDMRLTRIEDLIRRLLRRQAEPHLAKALGKMHAAEVAQIFSHLITEERQAAFRVVRNPRHRAQILTECDPHVGRELLEPMTNEEIATLIEELGSDDARYLMEMLPEERQTEVVGLMGAKETETLQDMMAYPPDSAGSIMTDSYVALLENTTVEEAIAQLRQASQEVEYIFYVYVVDDARNLRGVISLRQLLLAKPHQKLSDVMTPNVWRVNVLADQEHVAQLISRYNILAIPVVDEAGILVGLVTVDDVLDVLRDEATEDILKMFGTHHTEEVTSLSTVKLAWVRLPWLAVSWLGSLVSAYFIAQFSNELAKVLALAAFIPVINGTAGNVGAQGVAIMVRGLATGKVHPKAWFRTVLKQGAVGLILGGCFGILLYTLAIWQYPDVMYLGLIVGLSICISIVTSATLSAVLPFALHFLRLDPALMTGPFVTTCMDLVSVLVYFNIARFFLTMAG
ncbi:MAG: magnesium transporter [Deltaproteobacteria bacterium]|nr:magnesium transporter [Deltaproteobacteria bacterium]